MKDWSRILSDAGVELTEEQTAKVKADFAENYRTKADYDKVVAKRDEYKDSLDDVSEKLTKATQENSANSDDVAKLKADIESLTKQLAEEKDSREAEKVKRELEARIETFLSEKDEKGGSKYNFQNSITKEYYRNALIEEMGKETAKGKSLTEMLTELTTDEEGKVKEGIFVSQAEANKAKFTSSMGSGAKGTESKSLRGVSFEEMLKLKASNPEEYEARKKIKD